MLRCPRTHSGRDSGRQDGRCNRRRFHGRPRRAAPGACRWLDVRRRVGRAFRCVRPAARAISRDEGGREGGCADGWAAVRESVTLAGRAERARARPRVRGWGARPRAPVRGCGWSCWSASSSAIACGIAGSGAPGETVTVAVRPPEAASSGSRSPTGAGPGCRSCALPAVMRKAGGGFSLLRRWPRGGAGGGAAGGR